MKGVLDRVLMPGFAFNKQLNLFSMNKTTQDFKMYQFHYIVPMNRDIKLDYLMHNQSRIVLLFISLVFISACTTGSDPEKTGGEIIAEPEGPWCEFNISPDGKWLQLLGDSSPWFDSFDSNEPTHQTRSQFVDLETGELHTPDPQPDVIELIRKGFGPDWTGCFSSDSRTVYYSKSAWSDLTSPQTGVHMNEAGLEQPQTAMSLSARRQAERYHFAVDLSEKPLRLKQVNSVNCADTEEPKEPPITVRQVSDKRIQIYSDHGNLMATHKPRGLLSRRIHMADRLGSQRWDDKNTLSPDGTKLAYIVGESGMMFANPSQGHLVNLTKEGEQSSTFLAASVYSFQWSSNGDLFACTSHSRHHRAIVRWVQ